MNGLFAVAAGSPHEERSMYHSRLLKRRRVRGSVLICAGLKLAQCKAQLSRWAFATQDTACAAARKNSRRASVDDADDAVHLLVLGAAEVVAQKHELAGLLR